MQRSMDSDFEDENEICYTSKRRVHPLLPQYDDDSYPSSSWANTTEIDDDQRSSSIDYYHNDDDDEMDDELFQLPPSSDDLAVTPQQALHLASIYEFLRHFSSILRLSPFLFEHFCTAMINSFETNNFLFSQIHICLLRLFIKQDDDDGMTYASETDIKGIIDLSFVTMDDFTWPYVLQLYVCSHPQLKHLSHVVQEYPFHTEIDEKIELLLALCNVAMTTKIIRREFDDTKPKQHDDNCRQCQKRGDLLCCDRCEATYHLTCLHPPLTCVPTVEWFCPVCVQNQIHGVTDCIPPREHRPFYLRHRCIGHDREQRRYWFVCRRLFVEDEHGEDVRYYSTLDQFDALLSCLDERGPEKLLVYRLQKRYDDIARCMQITATLNDDDETDECRIPGQIDGVFDEMDEGDEERQTKPLVKKREFFVHSTHQNNGYPSKFNGHPYYSNESSISNGHHRFDSSKQALWEDRLRFEHRIDCEASIAVRRLHDEDIHPSIWQRLEHYQTINRYPSTHRGNAAGHHSYPRTNYYRDYYTGNNYEDEDGILLNNEYDDFGDDFFQQEENPDEFDMPFRKYESSRVYRGTTRGRPRGRGRPPLYGRAGGRASHTVQPPRGVNHLTTGSFQSTQRFLQPKIEQTSKPSEAPPAKNKRKPAKIKSVSMNSTADEKPKRPGKILRSGRISRKPRRDSETDFGSDNSDDSGAKDKQSGSDDDEEFHLNQLGFGSSSTMLPKGREGSSSSNDSLAVTNLPLTNFAAFAQSQLLATSGILQNPDDISADSDLSSDGFESDESDDILKVNSETLDDEDEHLDDFTYSQTMLSLINSMQPNQCSLDLDVVAQSKVDTYQNFYQTNPLATRKQMLLSERDRRAHLARKFSINHSPAFSWYSPNALINANYSAKQLSDVLRLTLVHFENTIPLPFMHSHWKRYRYVWAKQLLDLDERMTLGELVALFLQFEACIKPVSYFDLFTDQVGYLKFRRETEKERDEAKKEEKDALIRRKIDADSIVQHVHFTRPLKHTVHRQRGEEYRLAGGQGWTFIRSTRRSAPTEKKPKTFDIDALLNRREKMSNAVVHERQRILNLLETKLKNNLPSETDFEEEMKKLLVTGKDDNDDINDDLTFINYKLVDYKGIQYRYPVMSEDTRRSFHLAAAPKQEKQIGKNPFQLPLPWTFTFDNHTPNIFILPSYILRRLARSSMTLIDAPGFLNSRLTGIGTRFGWPYPCGRPSVRTAWCYKVQTSTSFFAISHHLKYLWNCIRWDLLTEKLTNIDESSITTQVDQDGMTTTVQVLAKRDSGPYDSYCEYFVRKTISSQTNDHSMLNNMPISKSRSRAIPHPSSMLTSNRLILSEQWLPERQLQPNQIKYYYQSLQDKAFKRLHRQTTGEKRKTKKAPMLTNGNSSQQTAKPFIVRIPHLQPKSVLNTETGKVVIVKGNGDSSSSASNHLPLPQQATKSFSVVKLADGQIILVPTTVQSSNANESVPSKIIRAKSPPPPLSSLSEQDRRLRTIAPSRTTTLLSSTELMNSLLVQQQQQLLLQQQAVAETVLIDTSTVKPLVESHAAVPIPKTKNVRKATPLALTTDETRKSSSAKKSPNEETKSAKASAKRATVQPKFDPEEGIRLRICEAILRSLTAKIDREQSNAAMKARLEKQNSTHRTGLVTRCLTERVDALRQEFIGHRLHRKTALVKEQVQTQRLKQQQLVLKQQQHATPVKEDEQEDESSSSKTAKSPTPSPSMKKTAKNSTNEVKTKKPRISKTTPKSTVTKRTRPLPEPTETVLPATKKARRSHVPPSDNDENRVQQRKSTPINAKMKSTNPTPKKIITIKNSATKKGQTEMNLSDIDCVCQQNDLPEKFFIQCELCSRWLHGKCVDLTPRLAEKITEFICEPCQQLTQRSKERLYCLCQTPYDESKFYIGCDVCADWLHGACVNLTPEEADKFEVYVCPRCSTEKKQEFLNQPINAERQKDVLNLIEQLSTHKMAWPFQKPVDGKDVPNYHKIIKEPMDLSTLRSKVLNHQFRTLCDFVRDVNKIFNNCRQFNPINSTLSQCANVVDTCFRQLLEQLMIKEEHA